MSQLVDIEEILRIAGQDNTKVVLVVPGKEPIVMLPLSQYDLIKPKTTKQPNQTIIKSTKKETNTHETIEKIDPIKGAVNGDDEYFPEPLE